MDRIEAMNAFVRVVDTGSFSRAAEALRVEQSTVSKWIQRLETELACTLIQRTTRQQQITDAGRLFYTRARELLALYDATTAELTNDTTIRGHLTVSVPVVFGQRHIVPFVAKFLRQHPQIDLELRFSDRYVNLVDDNVGVAIRVGTPMDSSFRARTIARAGRALVASPGYLKKHGTPRSPEQLAQHECLRHSGVAASVWTFERGGTEVRARVHGRFTANHSEALLALARGGHGIALLATWLVAEDMKRGRLVPVFGARSVYRTTPAPVQAVFPPAGRPHPRVRAFVDAAELHLEATLPR